MRVFRLLLWLPLFLTLTACPPGGKDSDDTVTDTVTDTDTQSSDEIPAYCAQSCTSNADCGLGQEAFDADNFDCNEGACLYTGCNSDAECESWLAGYVCAEVFGVSICLQGCDTSADCGLEGIAAHDADNYECTSGSCQYSGCNSNEECESLGEGLVCLENAQGLSACVQGCDTNADCDLGNAAQDADNHECTGGGCIYSGCNSDEECEESLGAEYICNQ